MQDDLILEILGLVEIREYFKIYLVSCCVEEI